MLDRQSRAPARTETAKLIYRAYELGVVLYYVGMNSNVLEMTPPLTITEDEIHDALDRLDQAIWDLPNVSKENLAQFTGW